MDFAKNAWLESYGVICLPRQSQGGVTPIGTVYRAATGVKIFDRRKMALTA